MVLMIVLLLSIPLCAFWGSANLSYSEVARFLLGKIFPAFKEEALTSVESIVWQLRMPRIILGLAVGGGLAICGVMMQALTKNLMAEPYILGVSSGASAMAVFAMTLGGGTWMEKFGVPGAAFIGAMGSLFMVYTISMKNGKTSAEKLLLSGVAFSMILNALTQFFILIAPDKATKNALYWMMGSLGGARWNNIGIPVVISILGFCISIILARDLNVLSLGDEAAVTLGINVSRIRKVLLVIISCVTGVMVSQSGCIGFIGLMIPHIVRMLFGTDHKKVLIASYLIGAIFLTWMDVGARVILAPSEISIGILTSFCGGPFFIWLLRRKK
ncbi:MAG: iron ABC transporter permease [Eubacteriales bacterium]|nr:iron ABC transporter permease [Eubacteriales bacterium]